MSLLLSLPAFAWLLCSAMFFALGEYLSKQWSLEPGWAMFAAVLLAYGVSVLSWLPVLLHKTSLTTMGTTWLLLGIIFTVLIGHLVFQEVLNPYQMTGLGFAVMAMLLMNLE